MRLNMKLIKYKVNKFRSVKGTDWIDADQSTTFVGVNESGKSNLLLPLWKFNPADDATKIDLLLDYPRDEFSEINVDKDRLGESFIDVLFEISAEEISLFEQWHNEDLTTSHNASGSTEPLQVAKIGFANHLLIRKDYNGSFYIYISNEKTEEKSDELEGIVSTAVFEKICASIPKFVYYSEYGNLDSDLYLPHVKDNLKRIESLTGKERMKARTLKILFDYLKLNPDEILTLGKEGLPNPNNSPKPQSQIDQESRNKQERFAKLDSASSRLTTQFREWWRQGDYIFHFNADGDYFRIFVSDTKRPEKIELESRSKGLQWFFSFFLVFLAESKDKHKDCILLLDEPGLSLHPNAQTDLIRFFDTLSNKNQLIYTTHLPFLVDHNNLDRVKAVFTENGLTKISNDLNKADKERKAIQPVNAAIGITASQSLLIGCDVVIVEGPSDQYYLTMMKNYLISAGKFQPQKELVFIPVGGVKGIKPIVSIIQGTQAELPFILLDSDKPGKDIQSDLKKGFYNSDTGKVLESDTFTGKSGSEIEDLLPLELIIDNFNKLFSGDEDLEINTIDSSLPILPQLETFAQTNNINLPHGWKAGLSARIKQRFKGEVAPELEKVWMQLFKSMQKKKVGNDNKVKAA